MPAFYGFSEAAKEFKNGQMQKSRKRAYGYLMQYFDDGIDNGVFVLGSLDY